MILQKAIPLFLSAIVRLSLGIMSCKYLPHSGAAFAFRQSFNSFCTSKTIPQRINCVKREADWPAEATGRARDARLALDWPEWREVVDQMVADWREADRPVEAIGRARDARLEFQSAVCTSYRTCGTASRMAGDRWTHCYCMVSTVTFTNLSILYNDNLINMYPFHHLSFLF